MNNEKIIKKLEEKYSCIIPNQEMFKDALRIQAEQHKQEKEHIFNELQKEWSEIIQKITAKQIFKEIDNEERKLRPKSSCQDSLRQAENSLMRKGKAFEIVKNNWVR